MHQQSRHPPRVSSPAVSAQTNPARTNNQRDPRSRTSTDAADRDGAGGGGQDGGGGALAHAASRDAIKKLDQIIQNFYYKAAVLIIGSRQHLTPGPKKGFNKWFSIETEDTEDFKEELRLYRNSDSFTNRPPPMIIETYIDASRISSSHSLALVDANGKRWDVLEALNSSESSEDSPRKRHLQKRNTEVILERWRIELKCIPNDDALQDFGPSLPTIYKRSIVFFRSLFLATRVMPGWKFSQQTMTKGIHPALEVKCRIVPAEAEFLNYDPLRQPLSDSKDVVTEYMFGDLEVPVGRFNASVIYRNDCTFRVEDADALLSSRLMGVDEDFFKPSIPQRPQPVSHGRADSYAEPGSLPSHRLGRRSREPHQTYGSLSTFHGTGAFGTSPISALKAVRPAGSDTSSPPGSSAASVDQSEPSHSLPIRSASSRTLRDVEGSRRPSISFQPFKAGSISGSPRFPDHGAPASSHSLPRPSGLSGISQARNRSSLTAGMAASLRGPGAAVPTDIPKSSSPRPQSRYSSSFSHRRSRTSFGGQSKTGDDEASSSGRQSLSSSAQPGSALLAEPVGGVASSSSFQTDDDISEFLKELDNRKKLPSFEATKKGEQSAAARRTAAQLNKFHLMRDSNNALTESMLMGSSTLHRSSSSSSRHMSNMPGSLGNPGISMSGASVSSSPGGKPLSPHTPHTPAIPSRLSENSIIDYPAQASHNRRGRSHVVPTEEEEEEEEEEEREDGDETTQADRQQETGGGAVSAAIDIPLSPRLLHAGSANRRASSVAQQHRSLAAGAGGGTGEDDSDIAQRSLSLGAGGGEAPSLSTLLAFQRRNSGDGNEDSSAGSGMAGMQQLQPAADIRASAELRQANEDQPTNPPVRLMTTSRTPYKSRYSYHGTTTSSTQGRGSGIGPGTRGTPPHSSGGPFTGMRYVGTMAGRGGMGVGQGEDGTDDEPLLFAMSELERPSRHSLEEARGGGVLGGSPRGLRGGAQGAREASGNTDGGGVGDGEEYEVRGTTRRGW
ncbi:autophagy-related protein 13-domain-containing protein [Neurospora hispaniola]|uniref:Autophagy-related protein 13 n=1 Tax=Neurospora hispaniola TaxID=588809 RepID=A0AAJ0MRM2_9PEZI|nr:autophagy-related protein 13-domain-containing protein [Neurospora hispaniola]